MNPPKPPPKKDHRAQFDGPLNIARAFHADAKRQAALVKS